MQSPKASDYGDVRPTKLSFDNAVEKLESALKKEGFGVLCLIDIQAKLKEKLGVDFPRYVILGACNPLLAQQALQRDINLGLLLPCNAVVYEECQGRSETRPLGRRKTRPDECAGYGDWPGGWRLERRPAVRFADRV